MAVLFVAVVRAVGLAVAEEEGRDLNCGVVRPVAVEEIRVLVRYRTRCYAGHGGSLDSLGQRFFNLDREGIIVLLPEFL